MYEDPMDMFQEMDEMFDRLFARMNRGFADGGMPVYQYRIVIGGEGPAGMAGMSAAPARAASEPVAEVHRIGNEVTVVVELPGASADSIRLDAADGRLTIGAEGCGTSYRTAADLPPVDAASMKSSFKNGVLEVTFAAAETAPADAGAGSA